jgi:putative membrane protein
MWEWHGFGFGGGFMWIFWILIIVAVVFLLKAGGGDRGSDERHETALEILEKRYARGEIDEEEFQRRKRELLG